MVFYKTNLKKCKGITNVKNDNKSYFEIRLSTHLLRIANSEKELYQELKQDDAKFSLLIEHFHEQN